MKNTQRIGLSNELGQLAQGVGDCISGTDTIDFIRKHEVPSNKKITYANFICDYRPLKTELYRVRLTVGSDKLEYEYDSSSPATSLLETKLILSSTISDASKGARFSSADLKDHFLASPIPENEYMRIHERYFLEDIRLQYKISNLVNTDGYACARILSTNLSLIATILVLKLLIFGTIKLVALSSAFVLIILVLSIFQKMILTIFFLLSSNTMQYESTMKEKTYCGYTIE